MEAKLYYPNMQTSTVVVDGEELLMNEEDAIATTEQIKLSIGNQKDFEMVSLATARNLDDLIGLTSTESGKLLSRFVGLEVIEHKSGSPAPAEWLVVLSCGLGVSALTWAGVFWILSGLFV